MNKEQILKEMNKYLNSLVDEFFELDEERPKKDKHCYSCGLQLTKHKVLDKLKELLWT